VRIIQSRTQSKLSTAFDINAPRLSKRIRKLKDTGGKLLAGTQPVPLMKLRLSEPTALIDNARHPRTVWCSRKG
jgi:hypothetical protein